MFRREKQSKCVIYIILQYSRKGITFFPLIGVGRRRKKLIEIKGMSLISTIQTITSICEKYKALTKENGENYNIFKVINLTSNEVRVHSAFIAHLFNPRESHGYDAVFLKLFIEHLKIEDFDLDSAKVLVERNIGVKTINTGGRLDIDIWDKNDFHIIIENKVYTGDQENQMTRYYNYGKSCRRFKLLYLTLDGTIPDEDYSCIDQITGYKLEIGEDYDLLSYAFDIKKWLEACREKAISNPLLREGISHYLNLIKHLTNQTMNITLKTEVETELLKEDNILNLALLKQSIAGTERALQLQFWNKLMTRFKQAGYKILSNNFEVGVERFYSSRKNNKWYGFEIFVSDIEQTSLRYGVRFDNYIYSGFTIWEGENNAKNANDEYVILRDKIEKINSSYQSNDYWLGWKWQQPQLNFQNINEETCKHLVAIDETIDIMFQDIDNDIKALQGLVSEETGT
jgi:hypothetical protein